MRPAAAVLVVAGALSAAACGSAPPPARVHPYRVLLLPVEGARTALEAPPVDNPIPFAITPEALETSISDAVVSSGVFSSVVVAPPTPADAGVREDAVVAAHQAVTTHGADLILRIHVRSARMSEIGNNDSTLWSTLTWTVVPLPIWFIDDRSYATELGVQAELYAPDDPAKPAASVVASSGPQDLDLWDRGPSFYVLVVPPPFLRGDRAKVSAALTERAVDQMLGALIDQLRELDIPSRFELSVTWAGSVPEVVAVSRRKLRSIEILVDGVRAASWVETGLVPDEESTADRFVYRRRPQSLPAAGGSATVRVIAEDEVGGREVRTIVFPARAERPAAKTR